MYINTFPLIDDSEKHAETPCNIKGLHVDHLVLSIHVLSHCLIIAGTSVNIINSHHCKPCQGEELASAASFAA
jgi:hypothetical protein